MAMACRPGRNQSLLQEIYESKMYTLAVQLDYFIAILQKIRLSSKISGLFMKNKFVKYCIRYCVCPFPAVSGKNY